MGLADLIGSMTRSLNALFSRKLESAHPFYFKVKGRLSKEMLEEVEKRRRDYACRCFNVISIHNYWQYIGECIIEIEGEVKVEENDRGFDG